jgi:F-type H+-transporting ATPase subunit b
MPQLSQLSQVYLSQFLWLAVALAFIFFVIARGMVPKIQATVQSREQKIASDLEAAREARDAAEATEADYRQKIDASRGEAMKLAQEAKQAGAREAEQRNQKVAAEIDAKTAKAEASIREAVEKARAELDGIAVEATREMVSKLTGATVAAAEATRAVKAVING